MRRQFGFIEGEKGGQGTTALRLRDGERTNSESRMYSQPELLKSRQGQNHFEASYESGDESSFRWGWSRRCLTPRGPFFPR